MAPIITTRQSMSNLQNHEKASGFHYSSFVHHLPIFTSQQPSKHISHRSYERFHDVLHIMEQGIVGRDFE